MFRYRLHTADGDDLGEATYAVLIQPGEEILVGNGRRSRVLHVVPFDKEDESPFVGLLQVEARRSSNAQLSVGAAGSRPKQSPSGR